MFLFRVNQSTVRSRARFSSKIRIRILVVKTMEELGTRSLEDLGTRSLAFWPEAQTLLDITYNTPHVWHRGGWGRANQNQTCRSVMTTI